MDILYQNVVKMAHEKPALRKHLVPLLRKYGSLSKRGTDLPLEKKVGFKYLQNAHALQVNLSMVFSDTPALDDYNLYRKEVQVFLKGLAKEIRARRSSTRIKSVVTINHPDKNTVTTPDSKETMILNVTWENPKMLWAICQRHARQGGWTLAGMYGDPPFDVM